jgi:Domain of unknown function (DUF4124)
MLARILAIGVVAVAAAAASVWPGGARADIYTWTDAEGRLNVSNLEPPAGVKVTKVEPSAPAKPPPSPEAVHAKAQADAISALSDQVAALKDQLATEDDLGGQGAGHASARARRASLWGPAAYADNGGFAQAATYAAPIYVTPMQTWVETNYTTPVASAGGCDPSWLGCSFGTSGVVVLNASDGNGGHGHPQPPMPPPQGQRPPMPGEGTRPPLPGEGPRPPLPIAPRQPMGTPVTPMYSTIGQQGSALPPGPHS